MISTQTSIVGTAAIVGLGQWVEDKKVSFRFIVGLGVFAFGIAVLGEANAQFAQNFGALVFVTALLIYGPEVARGLGLTSQVTKGIKKL